MVNPSLNGVQLFNIRLKDEEGVWGPLFKKTLTFSSQLILSVSIKQEYYFGDNDPGEGSGLPLVAFDGSFNEAVEIVRTI